MRPRANERFVYLAGPIMNCTDGEANDWRRYVSEKLAPHNIIGMSPLRCEPIKGERYSLSTPDPKFGVPRAIAAKNRFDVSQCDMGLIYIPRPRATESEADKLFRSWLHSGANMYQADRFDAFAAGMQAAKLHSFGTVGELFWTDEKGKQTILVSDDPFINAHPVIDAAADWKLSSFDDAIEVIVGVLGAYAGGKNV